MLEECQSRVVEEQGRLAWAVLRIGQLVQAMGIMVKYRDTEKRLRLALREKIKEQQAIKEKVKRIRETSEGMYSYISYDKVKILDYERFSYFIKLKFAGWL